jgi:hypothetical protein
MKSTKTLIAIIPCLALTASLHAETGPCATVNTALDRTIKGPTHIFSKRTAPSNQESETISLDGKIYVRAHGQWKLSPMTSAAMAAQRKENLSKSTQSCKAVGDESVGGTAATVYEASGKTEVGNDEAKFWIAKESGLLLKDEETIKDGKETVIQRSARYEYTGVKAPI